MTFSFQYIKSLNDKSKETILQLSGDLTCLSLNHVQLRGRSLYGFSIVLLSSRPLSRVSRLHASTDDHGLASMMQQADPVLGTGQDAHQGELTGTLSLEIS